MRSVDEQIHILDEAICKHIENYEMNKDRGFLSQSILKILRDFIEAVSVKSSGQSEYHYDLFKNVAKGYVASRAELKFLNDFHKYLQKTVSHYLPSEENSERLMLKYYDYLLRIKYLLKDRYNISVLENINKFPIFNDPSLQKYYEKIVIEINKPVETRRRSDYMDRYYVRKIKPFFINQEKYYEVTFTTANDYESKFDRVIAFTKWEISPNYSVRLSISHGNIEVFNKKMPIQIIDNWEVSIRPCELNYFVDIFGDHPEISIGSREYKNLMILLTGSGFNLAEVIEFSDKYYQLFRNEAIRNAQVTHIFDVLDRVRELVKNNSPSSNVLKYLLYSLKNKIIKDQINSKHCFLLSDLRLKWGCIPFDKMPFVTSPVGHNPKIHDLLNCFDIENHQHELFARLIKNNTGQKGILYTPLKDLEFENPNQLINSYNSKLYHKHRPARDLEIYKEHVYMNNYEQDTLKIIKKLKELSNLGIKNYSNSVSVWLNSSSENVDCSYKREILKKMFEHSGIALVYGAAGTGKTRLIEHVSSFFNEHNKLFLANTHPAINNLRNRVSTRNSSFKTIASFLHPQNMDTEFDVLIIDECSTISNSDMLRILEKSSFKLLLLVGDVFQIESILFGNWFNIAQSFIPNNSVFELTKPYRTTNENLLKLWDKVRNVEDDILEHITNNKYSAELDESIFEYSEDDEIILCLNYDGLYGINNINNFLQENNKNNKIQWGIHSYKVGDPILFNESGRFRQLIHNNLKGKILGIELLKDKIKFDIEINKSINELDVLGHDLELLGESKNGNSIISFYVHKLSSSDEDDESLNKIVPFQVAYAISIHKAQGLEYNSVKVIITDEIGEMITPNIFYTSITRSKEKLKIYWTPQTEKKILANLQHKDNKRDTHLLKAKFKI
ncbi:MAG: AAA family ATPase [Nanoarchaeota archaeon]